MTKATTPIVDTLDRQKIRFRNVDGVRTRYYEDGVGEALVLFSGGEFGSLYSLDSWSLNVVGLARHFHVYTVDKLGQGYTDNPKTDGDYTFEALFRHTYGLLQALGITGAHLVGHSRGAFLVTRLALEHPELVKTLIIVDSATTAADSPESDAGAFYVNIGRPGGRLPRGSTPTHEAVRVEPDAQAYSREQVTDDFVGRMLEIALLPKTHEAQGRMEALGESLWLPSLNRKRGDTLRMIHEKGLPVPTLVIWGLNDRSAPLRLGLQVFERICARTRQAELHVLNGAGHYSFRDQPQAFNRALQSFCIG